MSGQVKFVFCFGVALLLGPLARGQMIDNTQALNNAKAGINKSLTDEIGAGRGDVMTPNSSVFIINRDPFHFSRDLRQRTVPPRVKRSPPMEPVRGIRIAQHLIGDRHEGNASVLRTLCPHTRHDREAQQAQRRAGHASSVFESHRSLTHCTCVPAAARPPSVSAR